MTRVVPVGITAALLLAASLLITVLVTWHGGAVLASFHRDEDYEIPSIKASLIERGYDVPAVAADYSWQQERRIRIYYLWRTLQVAVYGDRILLFRITLSVLMVLSVAGLAFLLCRMGLPPAAGFALAVLTLAAGPRSIIWWRMGAAENFGIFFMIAALTMIPSAPCAPGRRLRDALFIGFAVCAAFSKESFFVVMPAFLGAKLWIESLLYREGWKATLRRNLGVTILMGAATAVQLTLILLVTGTVVDERIGVEGFDPVKVLRTSSQLMKDPVFAALGTAVLLSAFRPGFFGPGSRIGAKQRWIGILVLMTALVPTAVLYQKTGVTHIYHYPIVLFTGLAAGGVCADLLASASKPVRGLFMVLLAGLALAGISGAHSSSRAFLNEATELHRAVGRLADACLERKNILFVGDPVRHMESMNAARIYLKMKCPGAQPFYTPVWRANFTPFDRHIMRDDPDSPFKTFGGRVFVSPGPDGTERPVFDTVLVQPYSIVMFLAKSRSWFNISDYRQEKFGSLTLLTRINRVPT